MNRIVPIEDKSASGWRNRARRMNEDEFNDWLSGPPAGNSNARPTYGIPVPGNRAQTSKEAILVPQEQGQDRRARPRHKIDPYTPKGKNLIRPAPVQTSFAFITEEEDKLRGSIDTQV